MTSAFILATGLSNTMEIDCVCLGEKEKRRGKSGCMIDAHILKAVKLILKDPLHISIMDILLALCVHLVGCNWSNRRM